MEGPKIQNVVSTVNLCCKLDLPHIALHGKNVEYNPKRFGGAIMRTKNPRAVALIFGSGKLVIPGAKSVEDGERRAQKFCRIIKKLGYQTKFTDFKVRNMVASFSTGFPIQLGVMSDANGDCTFYEPEIFPALNFYSGKTTTEVFTSGKCQIAGAKTQSNIDETYAKILPLLKKYRK